MPTRQPRRRTSRSSNAARSGIDRLNELHGADRFFLFHRERRWNEREQRWMGWERKRGKLDGVQSAAARRDRHELHVRQGDLLDSADGPLRHHAGLRHAAADGSGPAPGRRAGASAEPAALRCQPRPRHRRLRRAAAARRGQRGQRQPDGVREGVLRPCRHRSVHDGGVRRLSGSLPRRQLRRQGHLRRRRVRSRARRTACPRTRCSATICSKGSTRGPACAPTSSSSTTTRRTTWRSRRGSTDGCAATGRSCAGCGARVPDANGRAVSATRCRSSRAGRSSTTCAAACCRRRWSRCSPPDGRCLPGSRAAVDGAGGPGAGLSGVRPGRPLARRAACAACRCASTSPRERDNLVTSARQVAALERRSWRTRAGVMARRHRADARGACWSRAGACSNGSPPIAPRSVDAVVRRRSATDVGGAGAGRRDRRCSWRCRARRVCLLALPILIALVLSPHRLRRPGRPLDARSAAARRAPSVRRCA